MKEVQWIDPDFLAPKDAWDRLSMKEKAAMMKVAVQNGITNLSDIRAKYNEFAEGGPVDTDWSYNSWKRQVAEHMGIRPDEDNTYDYEAYFNKYPEKAWKMLKGDPAAHFSDEFKTVYHPTFSSKSIGNDGSIYSGVRNPKTNPQGLIGGTWSPDYHTFTMSPDCYKGPVSMDDRKWYLENAEDNGVVLREADGSLPLYDGISWGGVLPNVTVHGNKHAEGGNLFRGGGSIVSDRLVDMTIEEEGFNKQPEDIGDGKMTLGSGLTASKWHNLYRKRGNKWSAADNRMAVRQELSDRERWARSNVPNWDNLPDSSKEALLMYKYNYDFNRANSPKLFAALEAGNLPEAARQMDATSKDPKFKKGLTNRRKREQAHFMLGVRPTPTAPNDIALQSPDNTFVYNPYLLQQQNTTMLPQVVPDEDAYVSTHEVSPEEIKAQKLQESFDNINRFNRTMEMLGNNLRIPTFHPTTGNDVLDLLWYTRGNDSPLLQMADEYARGGKIHIKEKNRGKFTRLKERTGKSASWFKAHGTPAQKKMATFALNARKWKHGFGGNLFSGEEDHSSQMNIGLNATNGWQPYTLGDIVANGERVARQRKALQDTFLNFPVEFNDATAVANGRPQNTHLEEKAVRGGAANAAWEKEHPGLAQLGYAASAIPFAVASAPLLGAAAETGAGQAVTAGLGWLGDAAVSSSLFTNAASRTLGTSTLLPWLDAGMTAGFGAHGIQETAEGNFTPMTMVDLAPIGIRTGIESINNLGKLRKYSRLEKNYTGVPHKQADGTSIYMDETFPKVHNEHTVWTSDDTDYAKMFALTRDKKGEVIRDSNGDTVFGKVFDVYTDPKELSVLQTPKTPDGQMVYWQGLPYKLKDGKVEFADITDIKENVIPKTKEIALNNRSENGWYDFDDTGHYIWKDGEGNLVMPDWKEVPGAISTDKVIQYSKDNGYQATRFNKVYDGGVTLNDKAGFSFDYGLGKYYDYPINELVLNPNAPKYILHHGTPKHKVFKQLPNIFEQPQIPFGVLPLTTYSNDKGR